MKPLNLALLLLAACFAAVSASLADDTADVKMTLLSSGAMPKLGGYRPQQLELSPDKPADLKKAPELAAPLYGAIHFGGKSYLVVLDEPDDKDAALYVDANGNGDLTDDAPATWKKKTVPGRGGKQVTQYSGEIKLPLGAGEKPTMVSLGAYRFDKNDPQRAALKSFIIYYSDYAWDGQITLNSASYHAMLSDDMAAGDFRGANGSAAPMARLLIDVNSDGKFSPRGEVFDPSKPFNIKGTTWKLDNLAADGSFKIVKSDQTVAEVLPPPDHSVGKSITPFTAEKMDGKSVSFPGDYKGKIVMLDFWATWCGPCMGEVPGLVKTYDEFHPQGFEVLGISLDQAKAADKVKHVTGEQKMTWPQVYDGKYWQAAIAEMYGIDSIPAAFLVDGDSGKILAVSSSLRGEALAKTLKAELEKKAAKSASGQEK